MELGERIRQARLGAGLSQKALCGDRITRNMLSQIEHGAARPSMDTLSYLAERLSRPVSWFLEEDAVDVPGAALLAGVLERFRSGAWGEARESLRDYPWGDALLDQMAALLLAQCALTEAKQDALPAERLREAEQWAERSALGGGLRDALTWERCRQAGTLLPEELPSPQRVLLARYCLAHQGAEAAAAILDGDTTPEALVLLGDALTGMGDHAGAAERYTQALDGASEGEKESLYGKLEAAYLALEDYKSAYRYAKLQKK